MDRLLITILIDNLDGKEPNYTVLSNAPQTADAFLMLGTTLNALGAQYVQRAAGMMKAGPKKERAENG